MQLFKYKNIFWKTKEKKEISFELNAIFLF